MFILTQGTPTLYFCGWEQDTRSLAFIPKWIYAPSNLRVYHTRQEAADIAQDLEQRYGDSINVKEI